MSDERYRMVNITPEELSDHILIEQAEERGLGGEWFPRDRKSVSAKYAFILADGTRHEVFRPVDLGTGDLLSDHGLSLGIKLKSEELDVVRRVIGGSTLV
jgi:hypothetical protein